MLSLIMTIFVVFSQNVEIKVSDFFESSTYIATAYNLKQCGKDKTHRLYGITANGTNLKGKDIRSKEKYIAVDPKKIKLGSKVYIEFDEEYSHLNGFYNVVDTGSAIKENRIDIYFGEENVDEALKFGKRKVKLIKI